MARLSDTQRRILESAVANAGLIIPVPRGAKARRAARALLRRGLLIETASQPGVLEWRRDGKAVWALGISTAGRKAIGWNEALLPDRSTVIAGRLIKVFEEAHGRQPASIEEFEAFMSAHVRAAWQRSKR